MEHWEEWTSEKNQLLGEHLEYMESGETLYDTIIRLSKLSPNRFCTYDGCPVPDCTMKGNCINPLKNFANKLKLWNSILKNQI